MHNLHYEPNNNQYGMCNLHNEKYPFAESVFIHTIIIRLLSG